MLLYHQIFSILRASEPFLRNGPDSENPAHTSNDENHVENQQSISIDLPELINTSYVSDSPSSNTHSPEKRVALEHPNEKSVSVGDTPPKIEAQIPTSEESEETPSARVLVNPGNLKVGGRAEFTPQVRNQYGDFELPTKDILDEHQ